MEVFSFAGLIYLLGAIISFLVVLMIKGIFSFIRLFKK